VCELLKNAPPVGLAKSVRNKYASDAIGYLIAREFPMRAPGGERGGPPIV
jgi:hypothetical protein